MLKTLIQTKTESKESGSQALNKEPLNSPLTAHDKSLVLKFSTDIIPKWEYIRTASADMNELNAIVGIIFS
jgi:hypothetical protein